MYACVYVYIYVQEDFEDTTRKHTLAKLRALLYGVKVLHYVVRKLDHPMLMVRTH